MSRNIIFEEHWNKYDMDWWVVIEEFNDKSIRALLIKLNRNNVPFEQKVLDSRNDVQAQIDIWFGPFEITFAPNTLNSNMLNSWVSFPNA